MLAGTGLGGATLSYVVPQVIGIDGAGWRRAFVLVAAVMAVFCLVPALVLIRNSPLAIGLKPYGADFMDTDRATRHDEAVGMTYRQALRSVWFYLLYAMLVLLGVVIAIVQGLSVHFADVGLTGSIGQFMMVITLGLVFWKIALGALIDAIGLRWSMIGTLGLCALACFFMPVATSFPLLVAMMFAIAAGTANGTVVPPLIGGITFEQREFAAIWGSRRPPSPWARQWVPRCGVPCTMPPAPMTWRSG